MAKNKNVFQVGNYVTIRNNKETREILGANYMNYQHRAYQVVNTTDGSAYGCMIQDIRERPVLLQMWNRHLKKLM
jgi:hypothetical protein